MNRLRTRSVGLVLLIAALSGLAAAQARAFDIDPDRSTIHVVTGRAGALGFLGHDHAILARDWSGRICYDADEVAASSAEFTVATPSLALDTDAAMAVADQSSRPGADTRADLQRDMLSAEYLDAQAYPEIHFESRLVSTSPEADLAVVGQFSLHGVTRVLRFPVEVTRSGDEAVRFQARSTARMTDHGIEPESTLGVINVADAFDIVVDVVARPSSQPCP